MFLSSTKTAACIGALVIAAGLAAGCAPTDAKMAAKAQSQLAVDPATSGLELKVAVANGVARISGPTRSGEQQDKALAIVAAIDGVTSTVDEMWIEDGALLETVRAAIKVDPELAVIPIDVQVTEGLVELTSSATNEPQRQRVVALVRGIRDVRGVENKMK